MSHYADRHREMYTDIQSAASTDRVRQTQLHQKTQRIMRRHFKRDTDASSDKDRYRDTKHIQWIFEKHTEMHRYTVS